jgi:hypothetical protein
VGGDDDEVGVLLMGDPEDFRSCLPGGLGSHSGYLGNRSAPIFRMTASSC